MSLRAALVWIIVKVIYCGSDSVHEFTQSLCTECVSHMVAVFDNVDVVL